MIWIARGSAILTWMISHQSTAASTGCPEAAILVAPIVATTAATAKLYRTNPVL